MVRSERGNLALRIRRGGKQRDHIHVGRGSLKSNVLHHGVVAP